MFHQIYIIVSAINGSLLIKDTNKILPTDISRLIINYIIIVFLVGGLQTVTVIASVEHGLEVLHLLMFAPLVFLILRVKARNLVLKERAASHLLLNLCLQGLSGAEWGSQRRKGVVRTQETLTRALFHERTTLSHLRVCHGRAALHTLLVINRRKYRRLFLLLLRQGQELLL